MSDKLTDAVDHYHSYTDVLKNFSPEVQKQRSQFYEIDSHRNQILNKLSRHSKKTKKLKSTQVQQRMKQMLTESLELADRKIHISEHIMALVANNILKLNMSLNDIDITNVCQSRVQDKPNKPKRMLKCVPNYTEIDSDFDDLFNEDISKNRLNRNKTKITKTSYKHSQMKANLDCNIQASSVQSDQSINTLTTNNNAIIHRSKSRNISESANSDTDVHPTYCICEDISYGNMVCCDNDLCPIEWFHFECVFLNKKPNGKWYCPKCRGNNSKTMKPKKIFFKELEEYNKSKEKDD